MNNMKFTVGAVQQEKLLELNEVINSKFKNLIENEKDDKQLKLLKAKWKDKLFDLKDAYILTYLKDIFPNKKIITKNVDGISFKWIDFSKLLNYLPLLGINNKDVLGRKFRKYEEYGLIKRHIHTGVNRLTGTFSGSFTFVHLTDNFYYFFEAFELNDSFDDLNKQAEFMGLDLSTDPTEKSCHGPYSKVASIDPTEKSAHNNLLYSNKNNTCNMSTCKIEKKENLGINKKGFPIQDKWEKFLIDNLDGIDYQINIQKAIAKLEKNHPESYIQKYLIETYNNGLSKKLSLKVIAGVIGKGNIIDKNQFKVKKVDVANPNDLIEPIPVNLKNKNIEKANEFMKKQKEDLNNLDKQKSNIILTPELELKAIDILKKQKINIDFYSNKRATFEIMMKTALKEQYQN